jgi:cell division protein FtsB
MMKASSVLSITLLGLATYLLLELVFGSYGFLALNAMNEYADEADAELDTLRARTAELRLHVELLQTDRETIRLEARDIGFIRPEETVVRLEGHEPRPRHRYMPGTTPPPIPVTRDNRPLFRALSLAVALVAALVGTLRNTARISTAGQNRRKDEWDVEVDGEPSHG